MYKPALFTGLLMLGTIATANASTPSPWLEFPREQAQQMEQEAELAAQDYANKVAKPAPTLEEYRYGMSLQVAKVVFVSPKPQFCGVVPKIMVFEDRNNTLRSVRYRSQGYCRNQR